MQKIRLLLILMLTVIGGVGELKAQYNSINIDYQTAAVMLAEYNAAAAAEMYYDEQVKDILEKYGIAEVAAAGIYTAKHLDRKALTSLGNWSSASENYYYRRIYNLVSAKIIPELWNLGTLLLHYPHKAIYWGTYLVKTCTEVKSLCHQFESVVTNGSLSFADINFLEINPTVASMIQLLQIGNVDWRSLLHSTTYVGQSFTKENLTSDIEAICSIGSSLASSGYESLVEKIMGNSSFDGTFTQRATSIYNIASNIYDVYSEADGNIANVLQTYWGDDPTAANLFSFSTYNMTGWVSDYLSQSEATYYTQRYYIACVDKGSETVCDYNPPTSDNAILNGSEWTRFSTSDPAFYPTSSQLEQVLSNNESYAGWSRSIVNTLNAQGGGYTYSFDTNLQSYVITKNKKQSKKAYAYGIKVIKSWYIEEVVYEEVFDSYTMSLSTFLMKMNAYLDEYNENEEGKVYKLLSDEKHYYQVASEAQVKGCESAVITLTCTDEINMGEGTTQYKCNSCSGTLNSHSKDCAMKSSLSASDLEGVDVSSLESDLQSLRKELQSIQSQLEELESNKAFLLELIDKYPDKTSNEYAELKKELAGVNSQITTCQNKIKSLQLDIDQYETAIYEANNDPEPSDDYYRIPAIMQEQKNIYRLTWQGEGWWSGYTYYRYATSSSFNGTITFKATISYARKPQYFLGIKIHRAILKISWSLSTTYTDTQVVDNITLDPDASDESKAKIINDRLSELARDFPNCTTAVQYIKSEDDAVEDDTEDTMHLLWSSDRLAVARQVEARLMAIYADIVSMKKMMYYKLGVIDALGGAIPYVNDEQGRKQTLAERCRMRWLRNAADRHHSLGYNGKYEIDDETE